MAIDGSRDIQSMMTFDRNSDRIVKPARKSGCPIHYCQ
jgi:hypothetical protein